MGKIVNPLMVKLIIGLIAKEVSSFEKNQRILSFKYGPIDFISPVFEFNLTDYYEKEMGKGLKRQFISFKKLILPERLADIKHLTNKLERKQTDAESNRIINIDPGYIALSKLVLATTKNFAHRIYIKNGIFEEITLYFKNGTFTRGKWTYPDYAADSHIAVFNEIRKRYYEQIIQYYGIGQLYRCV